MPPLKRKRAELSEAEQDMYVSGGEWVQGRMLGKGGFGSIYLAILKKRSSLFKGLPHIVAVKSTKLSVSVELVMEKSLLHTFRDCPFVIDRYVDDVTVDSDGAPIFNVFLEYADRGTLGDLIVKSKGFGLRECEARKYTKCILQGLKCIHEKGYVHCDVKPENILLVSSASTSGTDFVAKIGDFGLAKSAAKWNGGKPSCRVQGTETYLSPEAVVDGIQEQPSNIWALGCVVFQVVTGKLPWEFRTDKIFRDIKHRIASEIPNVPRWLSKEAQDFLGKCFVRNPSERFTAAMLLNHPFVCKPVEKLEKVSSFSSSEHCDHDSFIPLVNLCSNFIPLVSLSSEEAEEVEEKHLDFYNHYILPLEIMFPIGIQDLTT